MSVRVASRVLIHEFFCKKSAALERKAQATLEARELELQATYGLKLEKQRVYLNTARERARVAEFELGKSERKVQKLEKQIEEMEAEDESEDSDDESDGEADGDGPPSTVPFDLLPRRDEAGRFQAESPEVRATRWAQLARGVAPSTVSHNIQDVLSLISPGHELPAPTEITNRTLRTEVTIAGEAMAAWKFASAVRILSFGWDESTKFGNGVFSCNAQVKYADGTVEDICLRGLSVLPEGGKSAAVLAHIETRIFAHSRRLLTTWMEGYEKANGAGSWAAAGAPHPRLLRAARLPYHS